MNGKRLCQIIAGMAVNTWNYNNNVLFVVGGTYPEELKEIVPS
jgi:hypothetical protein